MENLSQLVTQEYYILILLLYINIIGLQVLRITHHCYGMHPTNTAKFERRLEPKESLADAFSGQKSASVEVLTADGRGTVSFE
jgi:hypothetical protein